jgi:hypothetical protein
MSVIETGFYAVPPPPAPIKYLYHHWPSILVGTFLIYSASAKLWSPSASLAILQRVWHMDNTSASLAYAALISIECALGMLILFRPSKLTRVIVIVFLLGVSVSLIRQLVLRDVSACGCGLGFGTGLRAHLAGLVRNCMLIFLCLMGVKV